MRTFLVTLVAALVQLGLAVLGWDGFTPFFAHPALIVLSVFVLAGCVVAVFTEGNLSAGVREARDNRWVLGAFSALTILLAYVPAYTDRSDLLTIDGDATRWIGIGVLAVGSVLRVWPVFVLGKRFSGLVAIQPDHALVTTGIYRRVRNPSYLGLLIGAAGWALTFRAGLGLVIAALFLVPLIPRMRAEERLLGEQFGADYQAYRAHTWRLLPGVY